MSDSSRRDLLEDRHDVHESHTVRIEARLKNARLYNSLKDRFTAIAKQMGATNGGFLRCACTLMDMPYQTIQRYIRLEESPYFSVASKGLKRSALRLCEELGASAEWLFPLDLYETDLPATFVIETSPTVVGLRQAADLASGEFPALVRNSERADLRRLVEEAIGTLTHQQQEVIRLRFGIGDNSEFTKAHVAHIMHRTPQRIGEIEAQALRKLRHPHTSFSLRSYRQ
jgi:hypothetical protein